MDLTYLNHLDGSMKERLNNRIRKLNRDIRTKGIKECKISPYMSADMLTGYSYGEFYDWDLYFENIYLSYYGFSKYCRINTEAFLNQQLECGFVARTMVQPRWRQHFKPFLAQTCVVGARQTGDWRWIRGKYYERLCRYLDYWFWFSDYDRNGLCVWDSADHSGMDNQISRAGEIFSQTVEGVDLNCYLYRELRAMALISGKLGLQEKVEQFDSMAENLKKRINDLLWDDKDAFYYDRHEREGRLIKMRSASSFAALWCGIPSQEQAAGMIEKHLLNPEEFWLEYPIASWAKNEQGYYQQRIEGECNWMGPCWIPINYMVMHGLVRYGYQEAAKELADKSFHMVLAEEETREYYDAETGVGQGLNPFWGWSSLAYFMPFELENSYDPTQITDAPMRPLGRDIFGLEFIG